jgi:hypothetical protein
VTLSIETITSLLAEVGTFPPMRPHEQTFMEISGYPHFENVCSNILQFYLQPSNEHGLGTLLLDTLLTIIEKPLADSREGTDVRREEQTATGKRLDLVIENDEYVIGIENKIFAAAYNDFSDYKNYLESLSKDRCVLGILLSLRTIKPSPDFHGFIPISYEHFFQQVLSKFGPYLLSAKEPHLTFFRDFVKTLQNLQETTAMDQQRLTYFRKNQINIETLLTEVNGLRDDMRRKVKQLETMLYFEEFPSPYPIKHGLWRPRTGLVDAIWGYFRLSESLALQVDLSVNLDGWNLQFYNGKGSKQEIEQWIAARKIKTETGQSSSWRLQYVGDTSIPYDASPEMICEWASSVIKILLAPVVETES